MPMVKVVAILGMGDLPPLIGILISWGPINPYYWVDDHPLVYGTNGSLDPGTYYQPKQCIFYRGNPTNITIDLHQL